MQRTMNRLDIASVARRMLELEAVLPPGEWRAFQNPQGGVAEAGEHGCVYRYEHPQEALGLIGPFDPAWFTCEFAAYARNNVRALAEAVLDADEVRVVPAPDPYVEGEIESWSDGHAHRYAPTSTLRERDATIAELQSGATVRMQLYLDACREATQGAATIAALTSELEAARSRSGDASFAGSQERQT